MPSKESIAVILAAMALGFRRKGTKNKSSSKDIEPLIEEVTYDKFKVAVSDFLKSRYPNKWGYRDKSIFFHGSSSIGDVNNPILKRNPKHPPIFSDQQELQTPDQGIYVTYNLDYALEYAGLEDEWDRENEKILFMERPGFEGKDHYVFILQINPDELLIDEDYLGALTFSVMNYASTFNLHNSYGTSIAFNPQAKEPIVLSLKKQFADPQSPISVLSNVYERTLEKYGNDRPSDSPYSLNDMDQFMGSRLMMYPDDNPMNKYFINESIEIQNNSDLTYDKKIYMPRLIIFLGKRMNKVMTKEESRILKESIARGKFILHQDWETLHYIMLGKPLLSISFDIESELNLPLFYPDPENKGIKPIKIYKILV